MTADSFFLIFCELNSKGTWMSMTELVTVSSQTTYLNIFFPESYFKIRVLGEEEISQQLGACFVHSENMSLIFSTHIGQLTSTCKSNFSGSDSGFLGCSSANGSLRGGDEKVQCEWKSYRDSDKRQTADPGI